ncbi:MAG: TIGR03960 family B12-binding radical SAM protein [Desulfohalobiaceae bacterium]|nr:TIGR03960 family B12-binding radical SAM protein [Desulfohalobiaceae bacterium]
MKELLSRFPRPTHYLGTEVNAVHKDPERISLRWGLAFPDLYEIGMSHLGLKILYHLLNAEDHIQAERVFAPHPDVGHELRRQGAPLCTLESDTPLSRLDILGFSLTHELCYTTVLYILDLAGIPFRADQRTENAPLIVGGGGATFNPEPVARFFDCLVIGDGEEAVLDISRLILQAKEAGQTRQDLLYCLREIPGLYLPSFFQESKTGRALVPVYPDYTRVEKRVLTDINTVDYPTSPVLPFGKAVHDRFTLEVARGCTRGCRFCQAGMTTRPVRERTLSELDRITVNGLNQTGFEELSFLALSVGDFSSLEALFDQSFTRCSQDQVAISLPSLRVGSISPHLMSLLSRLRRTGITLAPEAGSQRLRDVINKGIREEDLLDHTEKLFAQGWNRVKLYFMIGLPTETLEDLEAIVDLCLRVRSLAKKAKSKHLRITASISPFVPKAHTPFQWDAQDRLSTSKDKINYLRQLFAPHKGLELQWHDPEMSLVEGVFSRGGRDLDRVVEWAYQQGEILTGWKDFFGFQTWAEALKQTGLTPEDLTGASRLEDSLPWAHIRAGLAPGFLLKERELAEQGQATLDCRYHSCSGCGVCDGEASPSSALKAAPQKISPRLNQRQRDQENKPGEPEPVKNRTGLQEKKSHLRFWFEKLGPARYLSQLELQSILERAFRRAGLPMAFSGGFHPLPLLSFGQALPVGVLSLNEWCDLYLREEVAGSHLQAEAFNRFSPDGIRFTRIEELSLQRKQPRARFEEFEIRLPARSNQSNSAQEQWTGAMLLKSLILEHETKKGVKSVDVRGFLYEMRHVSSRKTRILLDWRQGYLSPLKIVQAVTPELDPTDLALTKIRQIM